MNNDHSEEYSYFEIKNAYARLLNFPEEQAERLGCIGKYESTMNTKTVVKKCEGVERKSRTRADGTGTAKLTLHMNMKVYRKLYGVKDDYIKGVYSYGDSSRHQPFCLTAEVYDEDGNEMLLAVPNTIIPSGKTMNIENGSEEVAEIEIELKIMPDNNGQGEYTAFVSELENDSVKESWLTNFTSDLVKKTVPTE